MRQCYRQRDVPLNDVEGNVAKAVEDKVSFLDLLKKAKNPTVQNLGKKIFKRTTKHL